MQIGQKSKTELLSTCCFAQIFSTFRIAFEMKENVRNDHTLTMPKIYDDKLAFIILFGAPAAGFNEPKQWQYTCI